MPRKIKNAGRKKLGLGTGEGKDYKAYLRATETTPRGRRHRTPNGGRIVHLLSDFEKNYYFETINKESVIEIREQFALELQDTLKIAKILGVKHPFNPRTKEWNVLTTDFLICTKDNKQYARTLKHACDLTDRVLEKFAIEKMYYQDRGIDWKYVTEEDFDVKRGKFLAECYFNYNLRIDERFKDIEFYKDAVSAFVQRLFEEMPLKNILDEFESDYELSPSSAMNLLKHVIVRKYITIDLSNGIDINKPIKILSTADIYSLEAKDILQIGETL